MRPASGPDGGSTREIAVAWIAVAAWIALIQTLASSSISADETLQAISPVLRWLFPNADAEWFALVNYGVRKAAHFVEYAILALLALRAFHLSSRQPPARLAAASLGLALAVAAVDESRQAATADRTGALSDVALDVTGAASALVLALRGPWRRFWSART